MLVNLVFPEVTASGCRQVVVVG